MTVSVSFKMVEFELKHCKHCKQAHIKLKPGVVSYKSRYYNLPKAYEYTAKKAIQRMVDIGVQKKNFRGTMTVLGLHHHLAYPKRLEIYGLLLI